MYKLETYIGKDKLPILEKQLICEEVVSASGPEKVHEMLNKYFRLSSRTEEYCFMVAMDTKCNIIGVFEVSHGSIDSSCVNPREVYMKALSCNAAGIIVAHNHPSGDPSPSSPDIAVAKRLKEAGDILGVKIFDFIICGEGCYYSFREHKRL